MATRFAPNGEKRGRDKGEVKVMRQSGGGGDRSNRHNYYCILLILLSAELQTDFRPTFVFACEKKVLVELSRGGQVYHPRDRVFYPTGLYSRLCIESLLMLSAEKIVILLLQHNNLSEASL